MYQQYLNQAQAAISNLSSDELKELLNDDEKLEIHVNDAVSQSYLSNILFVCRLDRHTHAHIFFCHRPSTKLCIVFVISVEKPGGR